MAYFYVADRTSGTPVVMVFYQMSDDTVRGLGDLDPCTNIVNHSPDGFEWGYSGSGPAQLALALLYHHMHKQLEWSEDIAKTKVLRWYQHFKADVIAPISQNNWRITSKSISDWMQTVGAKL